MKPLLRAVAVMAFLLVSETALAQTTIGVSDCGQWINQQNVARKAWLLGFLTGLDVMWTRWSMNTMKTIVHPLDKLNSAEQAYVWMDNYCRANPLENVGNGGVLLFIELQDK